MLYRKRGHRRGGAATKKKAEVEAKQKTVAKRGGGTATIERAEAEAIQITGTQRGAVRRSI